MLTFLRKIRRSLVRTGSTGRYLIYAAGEILLVMIGILLALQVNNWNQNKKDRILEIEILKEIGNNLNQDLDDHNQNLDYLSNVVNSSQVVLNHLNNDLPYHDSLAKHFAWLPITPNFDAITSGYDLLKSKGFNIITNDSIRQHISSLYGKNYNWLRDFLKDRWDQNNAPLFENMMTKFKTFEIMNRASPRDYEQLKNDEDFKVLVQQNGYNLKVTRIIYNGIMAEIDFLTNLIQNEIKKLEKN